LGEGLVVARLDSLEQFGLAGGIVWQRLGWIGLRPLDRFPAQPAWRRFRRFWVKPRDDHALS
jgi:hypothetical protein